MHAIYPLCSKCHDNQKAVVSDGYTVGLLSGIRCWQIIEMALVKDFRFWFLVDRWIFHDWSIMLGWKCAWKEDFSQSQRLMLAVRYEERAFGGCCSNWVAFQHEDGAASDIPLLAVSIKVNTDQHLWPVITLTLPFWTNSTFVNNNRLRSEQPRSDSWRWYWYQLHNHHYLDWFPVWPAT